MRLLVLEYKDMWHPEAGGAEVYVSAIAHEWANQGHDVTIFTSRNNRPHWEVVDDITFVRAGSKFSVFRRAASFLNRRSDDFDFVLDCVNQRPFLAHEFAPTKTASLVLHLGLELWNTEFGFPFNVIGRRFLEPRWMRRLKTAEHVVAISDSTARSLERYGISCKSVIPPATSIPVGRGSSRVFSSPPRILFIGRLVRNKRPQDALAAFDMIRRQHPDAVLDVVGTGYLLPELRTLDDSHIHVHGFVGEEQKRVLLEGAHLLVVPSIREGWGIVVNEAAAAGVPTIAYDVPGLKDSVTDGVTGILCEPSPTAMAKHATELLQDSPRWERMSKACTERTRNWTWEKAANLLLEHPGSSGARVVIPSSDIAGRSDPNLQSLDVFMESPDSTLTKERPDQKKMVASEFAGRGTPSPSARNVGKGGKPATLISGLIAAAALSAGLALRILAAYRMPWRDDEIVYVKWTGSWFANHFWQYLFQFQQTSYPPRSPYFANPPLAMWIFGGSIRVGHIFGASDLISARLTNVAIGILTGVLLFVVVRRWLGPLSASIVIIAYSLLPLVVVTNASAFLETTSAFLTVAALALLRRFRRTTGAGAGIGLSLVLGFCLLTKLSLVVIPVVIGGVAVYHSLKAQRRLLAALLVAIPIILPVVVWSGYRTPSQYVGVFAFLHSKYAGPLYADPFRYPFGLLSDVPLVLLIAWLGSFSSLDRRLRERLARFSFEVILVAVLPVAGLVELAVSAPTSFDYQLLPLMPLLLIAAAWSLTAFAVTIPRLISGCIGAVACVEVVLLYVGLSFGNLSLSTTPTGRVVRTVDPTIDVPYGTGSEALPSVASFIDKNLPHNIRIAATYADYTLRQYLHSGQTIGAWFPYQSVTDLTKNAYDYGVFVDHDVPISSPARASVKALHPLFQVSVNGQVIASLYRVPRPTALDTLELGSSWRITSKRTKVIQYRAKVNTLEAKGTPVRPHSVEFLAAINSQPVLLETKTFGIPLLINSIGGTENVYVDFLSPRYPAAANYWRARIFVDWIGPLRVVVPFDELSPVRLLQNRGLPNLRKPVLIRFATDSQIGTVPYIGVSSTAASFALR